MKTDFPELDPVKRLVFPAKDPKSAIDLGKISKADLCRLFAKKAGFKYNEIGDKAFIDPTQNWVKPTPPTVTPQDPNAVTFPSGHVVARSAHNNSTKFATTGSALAAPLVVLTKNVKVSEHFSLFEFRCNGPGFDEGVRVSNKLIELLEKIRAKVGGPIRITSAYRPPEWNREVGGVSNSQHLDGIAADIYADKVNTARLYDIADAIVGSSGGVGYYPLQGFVHVDTRGYEARWNG